MAMNTSPATVSVTTPVNIALEHVKLVLFRPFDLSRWFVIGFCAWLAWLAEGGGGGGSYGWREDSPRHLSRWFSENAHWLVPLIAVGIIAGLVFYLLLLWLSSRGKFMFLHCVVFNRAEVRVPWSLYGPQANSLFLFRVVVGAIGFVILLPAIGLGAWLVFQLDHARGGAELLGVVGLIGMALVGVLVALAFAIVSKLTTDFVVPLMLHHRLAVMDAWSRLLNLIGDNLGRFIGYLLFQIVLAIGAAILVVALVLATCCLAGCLLVIPYLGAVLLLPLFVFDRAYSLHYLRQYGPDYDLFLIPPTTPPSGESAPSVGAA